jgi:hypothetical protein
MIPQLRLLLPVALVCLTGCPVWEPLASCADFDACSSTGAASTTTDTVPTTSADGGIHTVTGDAEDGSTAPSETSASMDLPAELPSIIDFDLSPNPITANGPISVTVTTTHTTGVRMDTGLGDVVELSAQPEPGVFVGEITVLTGLSNGSFAALLTPWDAVDGASVEAPYEIALPTPGSEKLWETGDLIGPGRVVALGTRPTGELVELGNYSPNGEPRCYLRSRDQAGLWALDDVVDVLPDTPCQAIDLKIDAEGALFVLVQQQSNDGLRWRLMKIPVWGESPQHMGLGAKGEDAVALALHPAETVAVCGTAPTGQEDGVDAMVKIFKPDSPGEPWVGEYRPIDKPPHWFAERTQDCVFVEDTLALVGAALGEHQMETEDRERLFIVRLDITSTSADWFVPSPGAKTQSAAQAVDADELGRLVVGAYTCDDDCDPAGELRIYDNDDILTWQTSLGDFPTPAYCVQDVAWSAAGYAVVATGGLEGDEAAFTVRAFSPEQEEALWAFAREDLPFLHFALALAIGDLGEVYAGGFGANGYPAVAFIAG